MIETVIAQVMAARTPSSGENLDGFEIDLDAALFAQVVGDNEVLTDPSIVRTQDPLCMLEARAAVHPAVTSIFDVFQALWRVWAGARYHTFEAASLISYPDAVVLRFVTAGSEPLCVSGRVVVSGQKAKALLAEYAREHGPLPRHPTTSAA
jgi:hypothetical protein